MSRNQAQEEERAQESVCPLPQRWPGFKTASQIGTDFLISTMQHALQNVTKMAALRETHQELAAE